MSESRRMMSSVVMEYPRFIRMNALPKLLYNYMCLYTDEYGVCAEIDKALLYSGAKRKDLECLIRNGYVMDFGDDIYLIKHFPMFNSFRKDRMKPCRFQEQLDRVFINDNKVYSWNVGQLTDKCQADDRQMTDKCQADDRQLTDKCPHKIREDNIREDNSRKDNIISSMDELRKVMRGS